MKAKTKLVLLIICSIISLGVAVGSVFAWFANMNTASIAVTKSGIIDSYFESGNGSSASPFEVKTADQLYYLAWLQQLGFFNQPAEKEGSPGEYEDYIKQYYFYLSDNINMNGYTLPPIGTLSNPFVGNFNGNGKKISNLKITNDDSAHTNEPAIDNEDKIQVVGFFGVIGAYEADGTITVGGKDYTYNTSVNSAYNFLLDSVTVETKTPLDDKTLVGIVAGYVNGEISSVGVYNCSIEVGDGLSALSEDELTDKISCYSLVGYSKSAMDAYVIHEGSDGNEWGGSLDMTAAHGRLATAFVTNSTTTNRENYTYAKTRNVFYDKDGNSLGDTQTNSSTAYYKYKNYNSTGGAYLLAMRGANTVEGSGQYFYLNGGVRMTDTKYYYVNAAGYYISDRTGDYYLQAQTGNGSSAGTVSHSDSEGTVWLYSGNTLYLEYVANKSTTAVKYYLGVDAYGRITCTTTSANWTVSGNDIYSGSNYLVHVNGANGGWTATDNNDLIKITNGTNYLGNITNATSVADATAANAAVWAVTDGYIHTVINGNTYYLNRSNTTVSISTTPSTVWSVTSTAIASGGYVLRYNNGTWQATQTTSYITDGNNHYLTGNGSIGNSNTTAGASEWTMTATNNNYYISTGNYYLLNNNGTLQVTTNSGDRTAWTVNGGVITNGDYQLTYDNGWKLSQQSYYITDGTNYLNNTSSYTISSGNSQASATRWIYSNNRYYSSTNTNYYLVYYSNSYKLIAYSSGTAYALDSNNRLYATVSGVWSSTTYYVRYNNGWTLSTTAGDAATITLIPTVQDTQIIPTATYLDNADVSYAGTQRVSDTTKEYTSEVLPTYVDYNQGYATYMPLIVDKDDSTLAKSSNTGYIVGGSFDTTTSLTYPYGAGDIRISYYTISDHISNSYDNSTETLYTDKIYTIKYDTDMSTIITTTVSDIGADNFEKYNDASKGFRDILKKDNTNVYGLHFMSALISKDNVINASQVRINGETYENYKLPASSIDFNLSKRGYINFFAGTYFSTTINSTTYYNNCFFSLHKIFREGVTITDIKEIQKIYVHEDENKLYIYEYTDGTKTYSDGTAVAVLPAGYVEKFNTDWIKTQASLNRNVIYYFEIPADEGEYALGSVDGGTGAYLLYLDISANAGDLDKDVMKYVEGVDYVTASDVSLLAAIADNHPTATFGIKEDFSGDIGSITVKREEANNIITFTVTCSDTSVSQSDLKKYIRYYYIVPDGKEIAPIVWQVVS